MSLTESKLLLEQAKLVLNEIESSYDQYLSFVDVSIELQLKIKDFHDKINPALDYAAFTIFTSYCAKNIIPEKLNGAESRVYFPCKKTDSEFENYLKKVFPNLIFEKPDIVDVFRKYQPFPARSKWLHHLRELVSHNKHRNLTRQSHRQTTSIKRLNLPGLQITNSTLQINDNKNFVPIQGLSVDLQDLPDAIFEGTTETDFIFSDINLPVLKTLKRIYASAPTVIKDLEQFV